MKKLQLYIGLTSVTFLSVVLAVYGLMVVLRAFVAICFITVIISTTSFAYFEIKDAFDDFQYRRKLQYLLGDMTLEEVLEKSPYEYGYVFQGDDGYRIWAKGDRFNFVPSFFSKKSARMWIVEQYFIDS